MIQWRHLMMILFLATVFSCQKNDLNDLQDTLHVRHNNADMPAYIFGNGASKVFLIILHGGPGGSGLEYRIGKYKDALEDKYAVVYWDQRGQGMAQGTYDKEDITVANIVEDVKALALTLRHKYGNDIDLFLLGHSWGGLLGSAFLTTNDYQDYIQGWIEVSGAHDFPELYRKSVSSYYIIGNEQIALGNDVTFWTEVLKRVDQIDSLDVNFDDFSYMNITARTVEEKLTAKGFINTTDPDAVGNSLVNTVFINSRSLAAASGNKTNETLFKNELLNYSVTDQLHKITIPSLILWGEKDLVVPVQLAQQAYDNIGSIDKEIILYPQSGHSPMVTEPDPFASDIIRFIEQFR